jgi:hypothetical protein
MLCTFHKYQPDMKAEEIWAVHFQAVRELGEEYADKLPTE